MSETLSYKQGVAIEESKMYSGILLLKARVKVLEAALMREVSRPGLLGCTDRA